MNDDDRDWTIHDTDEAIARAQAEHDRRNQLIRDAAEIGKRFEFTSDNESRELGLPTDAEAREVSERAEREGWTTLASFTAEQTAELFAGRDPGPPTIHDETIVRRMEHQRQLMHAALYDEVIPAIVRALEAESGSTAARLSMLAAEARSGGARASQLMSAMLGELLTMGLKP